MIEFLNQVMPNVVEYYPDLLKSLYETLIMVSIAGFFATIIGLPIGVILVVTRPKHLLENKWIQQIVGKSMNVLRSIPFIILLTFIIPFTKFVVGTSIGLKGAIVPLIVGTTPFVARQIESALINVDSGVVEAAKAMGSSPFEIITRVLLREGLSGIIYALTITIVSLIGFSAIAGTVGGGGLGDFAIRYGYQYFKGDIMFVTVIILLIIVSCVQSFGEKLQRKVSH